MKTVLYDLEIARTKQQCESRKTKAELLAWNSCFTATSIFVPVELEKCESKATGQQAGS